MLAAMIYFDHAASTVMFDEAHEILCTSFKSDFANPAAKHALGQKLSKRIDQARIDLCQIFSLKNFETIFTSSATESNNLVIKSFLDIGKVIYFKADHPSVTSVCKEMDGLGFAEDLLAAIDGETALVVLTLVNAQSGTILDIDKYSVEIKKINPKIKIHLDCAQAAGKIKFNFNQDFIDSIAIAAHKFGGPKGISALFYKKDLALAPLLMGGGHEHGLRSSTPSAPLIFSMLKAASLAQNLVDENFSRVQEIKTYIVEELQNAHKNISFPFEGKTTSVSPYILGVKFTGISSDIILRHLEMKNIFISTTTACSSKISGFNPILLGLGIEEKFHKNILRISFGLLSNIEEAKEFVQDFKEMLKEISFLIK